MKKSMMTLLLACVSLVTFAQKGPVFQFKDKNDTYDFGTIKEGTSVTHEFEFTNVGNQPLIIMTAEASCGCTTPEWPKTPIMPGKSGKIKVTFNSTGKAGPANKPVYIKSNAILPDKTKERYEVTLVGTVTAK